jgi:hypothetical protein
MSEKPTVRDPALQRLIDEGYEVEVRQQHLLVYAVPYAAVDRIVKRATIICTFIENAGTVLPPDNHQVWFTGEFPCLANGSQISQIVSESNRQELFKDCWIRHRFSNKPEGVSNFTDHYSKIVHYVTLLSDQARAIDPLADARTGRVIEAEEGQSVFKYADTASARAEILMVSARLDISKVAIVGLGGTGSYVLDQVAKTPVGEIHLFDGDEFLQHNAFRAPGAATVDELKQRMPKTRYFKLRYDSMRRGIESHEYNLNQTNVSELAGFDFVFVCVDKGPARAIICRYLQSQDIRFVDVGMSVEMVPETLSLVGTCRFTLSTPSQKAHIERYVPMMDDGEDALYRQNIQVADMNALNAILAVMKWKQVFGFYQDDFQSHHGTFSVSSQSLTRDVMTGVASG